MSSHCIRGGYDPAPLRLALRVELEDLVHGGPPKHKVQEREKIKRAVAATLALLRSGEGVIAHCCGGRGRTGTVLGCTLRELGFGADETIRYLDRVHKDRGKSGWPESDWQSSLVQAWTQRSD